MAHLQVNHETKAVSTVNDTCPWCGHRWLGIAYVGQPALPDQFSVVCTNPKCRAEGPKGDSSGAYTRWVTRKTP